MANSFFLLVGLVVQFIPKGLQLLHIVYQIKYIHLIWRFQNFMVITSLMSPATFLLAISRI